MAVNALRDDLFSLITAFASPRQGPKDNVAVIAQEAQEQAQQPQAQEVPDAPLPFVAPQPVASKLVGGTQVAGTGVVPTDPESTGSVTPSGPQTPRPPGPTVIPELPPKPATPPPAANDPNASTGFIGGRPAATAAPIADVPDDGGFNAFQAYQAAQDKAAEREAKAHAMQSFISGGQMLAGSLTRSPSMRENLFGMAQQNAPRGGDGSGAKSGAPSLTEFTKLHELALTASQRKSLLGQLPALAKQTGASMERLRLMADTDPKKLAEFIADASKSDKVTGQMDDGTLYSYEKKDPKGTLQYFGERDPFKVRDQAIQEGEFGIKQKQEERTVQDRDALGALKSRVAARLGVSEEAANAILLNNKELGTRMATQDLDLRTDAEGNLWGYDKNDVNAKPVRIRMDEEGAKKLRIELAQKQMQTKETEKDIDIKTEQLRKNAALREQLPRITERYQLQPGQAEDLFNTGKLDQFMLDRDKGSDPYQKWVDLRREEIIKGVPKEKQTPYSDFMWSTAFANSPTGGPGGKMFLDNTLPELKESKKATMASIQTLPTMNDRLRMIENGEIAAGPIEGSDTFQTMAEWAKTIYPDLNIGKVENARLFKASMETIMARSLKQYGMPTDKDAVRALSQFGEGDRTPETLGKITRWIIRDSVVKANAHNKQVDDLLKDPNLNRDPTLAAQLRASRIDVGDQADAMFDKQGETVKMFQAALNDPDLTDKERAKFLRDFDNKWGRGMSDYLMQTYPDWMPPTGR